MPRGSNPEPEVMTWGKAAPVLIASLISDALRGFFSLFWFFGPALGTLFCALKLDAVGTTAAVTVCTAAGAALGAAASAAMITLGTIMAMAIGVAGWLAVGFLILTTNARILKTDATAIIWILGGFALSEIPLIDSLPFMTGTVWKLYHTQIRRETEAHKAWREATEERRQRDAAAEAQAAMLQAAEPPPMAPAEGEHADRSARALPVLQPITLPPQRGAAPAQRAALAAPAVENAARRNFLRRSLALAGSSFVSSYSLSPLVALAAPTAADLAPDKAQATFDAAYETGMRALHQEALQSEREDIGVFFVKQGGASEWVNIRDKDNDRFDTHAFLPYSYLEDVGERSDVVSVEMVHTHPLTAIYLDAAQQNAVRAGKLAPPMMPPSITDIMSTITLQRDLPKATTSKLLESVVDPSGVWTYSINKANPTMQKILQTQEMVREFGDRMQHSGDLDRLARAGKISINSSEHPAVAGLHLIEVLANDPSLLSKSTAADFAALEKQMNSLASGSKPYQEFIAQVEMGAYPKTPTPENVEHLKEIYRDIGVELTFTPFK